ncbi:hypothetical protein BDV12DRAFT_180346 [Aspergillus spectabilis]
MCHQQCELLLVFLGQLAELHSSNLSADVGNNVLDFGLTLGKEVFERGVRINSGVMVFERGQRWIALGLVIPGRKILRIRQL